MSKRSNTDMNRPLRFFLAASLVGAPALVLAQSTRRAPAKAPASSGASTKNNNVIISSPDGEAEYLDPIGVARYNKNVTVVQAGEDFILRCQVLTYSKPKNTAIATGSLRIDTRDSTLRGEQLRGDFNTKTFVLTGNVVISAHGKKDGINGNNQTLRAEVESKPVRIACNRADWEYDTRQATLVGNIRMVQGKTVGTCEQIKYDERQNIVRLINDVRFTDATGNTITAEEIVYYVDSGRVAAKRSKIIFQNEEFNAPNRTTRTTPKPRETFAPPPTISDDVLKQFDVAPAPIAPPRARPTATPEPTEAPEAPEPETVTEPTAAPETSEKPLAPDPPRRDRRR
jgi:lipopolysaccharide export system protein LptA